LLVAALTAPDGAIGTAAPGDRCAAASILLDRWSGEKLAQTDHSWTQWNVARKRATRAVRAREAELRQLACPKSRDTVRAGAGT
jgi:hypothetical protein